MIVTVPKVGDEVYNRIELRGDVGFHVMENSAGVVTEVKYPKNGEDDFTIVVGFRNKNRTLTPDSDGKWSFYPEWGREEHPNGFEMGTLAQFHYYMGFTEADNDMEAFRSSHEMFNI